MRTQTEISRQDLLRRLKRIEGQVRGIHRMLENDRECHEIVQQLSAVQAAVRNTGRQLVVAYAQELLLAEDELDARTTAQRARSLVELIEKAP